MKHLLISFFTFIIGLQANAGVKFGLPIAGGAGCPSGFNRVAFPKSGVVVIDHPELSLGDLLDAGLERRNCALRIPISGIPKGYKLTIRPLVSDLSYSLAVGDQLKVEQSTGFVGGRNSLPVKWAAPSGTSSNNVKLGGLVPGLALSETACGTTDTMLTANVSSLLIKAATSSSVISRARLLRSQLSLRLVKCL